MRWEEPPSTGRARQRGWWDESAELQAHPDRWALLVEKETPTAARMMVRSIRKGRLRAFRPPGSFEACVDGAKVYARYVGGER